MLLVLVGMANLVSLVACVSSRSRASMSSLILREPTIKLCWQLGFIYGVQRLSRKERHTKRCSLWQHEIRMLDKLGKKQACAVRQWKLMRRSSWRTRTVRVCMRSMVVHSDVLFRLLWQTLSFHFPPCTLLPARKAIDAAGSTQGVSSCSF